MSSSKNFNCPFHSCERSFDSKNGLHVHHHHAHGESIAREETDCAECDKSFSYYPSIKDGVLCSECLDKGIDPVQNRPDTIPNDAPKVSVQCRHCEDYKTVLESRFKQDKNYFCDDICYNDFRRERNIVDTTCDNCEDDLPMTRSRYEDHNNHFCDPECRLEYQRNSIKIFCSHCGDSKYKPRSHVKDNNRNFCDKECRREYQIKNKKVDVECSNCEDNFTKVKSRYTYYDVHFCEEDCQYEYYTKENEFDSDRYGRGWIDTRKRVRERDNYKCQICGKNEGDIGKMPSAHHITPVYWFYNHEDYSKGDAHYESNVVLLCPEHHVRVEHNKISLKKSLPDEKVSELDFIPPEPDE